MKVSAVMCAKCRRGLIVVSNERGVRYWEEELKLGGTKLRDGFTKVGRYFIRISYRSSKVAEVWGDRFAFSKKCLRTLCPECMEMYLKEKGV